MEVQIFLLELALCFGSDLAAALQEAMKSPMIWFGELKLGRRVQERLGLETAKRDRTGTPFSKPGGVQLQNENDAIAKNGRHRKHCKTRVLETLQLQLRWRTVQLHAWTSDYM